MSKGSGGTRSGGTESGGRGATINSSNEKRLEDLASIAKASGATYTKVGEDGLRTVSVGQPRATSMGMWQETKDVKDVPQLKVGYSNSPIDNNVYIEHHPNGGYRIMEQGGRPDKPSRSTSHTKEQAIKAIKDFLKYYK